jgi:hypothetical protein
MLQFRLRKHIAVCGVLKSGWRRTGHVHRAFSRPRVTKSKLCLRFVKAILARRKRLPLPIFKFAKSQEDRLYWTRVEALILKQEPTVVMERLSNNKLKRNATRKRSLMG